MCSSDLGRHRTWWRSQPEPTRFCEQRGPWAPADFVCGRAPSILVWRLRSREQPVVGSANGELPKRPKGSDCKSAVIDFGGSNPSLATHRTPRTPGISSESGAFAYPETSFPLTSACRADGAGFEATVECCSIKRRVPRPAEHPRIWNAAGLPQPWSLPHLRGWGHDLPR